MPALIVIDPAISRPEVECFNWMAENISQYGIRASYFLPSFGAFDPKAFSRRDLQNIVGMVVLGSAASVHDHRTWQEPMNIWVKERALEGIPTLGLCYGHQMLATIFGGEVSYSDSQTRIKHKGFRRTEVFSCEFLPSPLKGEAAVSHREIVSKLPPQFVLAGKSENSFENDVIRHRSLPAFGFQAHIEAIPALLKNFSFPLPHDDVRLEFGQTVVRQFLHFCARRAGMK